MKTFLSRNQARKKQTKTPVSAAELAKSGFYIMGNEYSLMDLVITEYADGFYYGTRKLTDMFQVSNLVYNGR